MNISCFGFPDFFTTGVYMLKFEIMIFCPLFITAFLFGSENQCLYWQVYSREAWRSAIRTRSYDKQCDRLVWGLESHFKKEEKNVSS
jgi:hypothetical protein